MRSEVKAAIAVGLVVFVGAIIWAVNSTEKADNIPFDLPAEETRPTESADLVADITPVRRQPPGTPTKTEQPPVLSYEPLSIRPETSEPKRPASEPDAEAPVEKRTPSSAPADVGAGAGDVALRAAETPKPVPPSPEREAARLKSLQKPPARGSSYTIEPGDTLISIAREHYGADKYWTAIRAANPDADPESLQVGQVIALPPKEQVLRAAAKTTERKKPGDALTYVVEPGDSLIAIARNVLKDESRYLEIFELNRDKLESPDDVRAGIELRLPPLKKKPVQKDKPKDDD